jgi:hypothetical protein
MLSTSKPTTVHSPQSSGAEEWGLERRANAEVDENNSVSQSDESEGNEEYDQPMHEDSDEQLPDYSRDNSASSPLQMMDDESEDNGEDDEDNGEDDEEGEDGVDYDAEHPVDEGNDDTEMSGDEELDDDDEDDDDGGGQGGVGNINDDEDGSSYSSEYSE